MPYVKQYQRKHISDEMVQRACSIREQFPLFPWVDRPFLTDILMHETGAPEKVVVAKLEQCADRGLLEVGVSLRTGWWVGDIES